MESIIEMVDLEVVLFVVEERFTNYEWNMEDERR